MIDSAMFLSDWYALSLVARSTYPALGFPQYAGEVGASDADTTARRRRRNPPLPLSRSRLRCSTRFTWTGSPSSAVHALDRRHEALQLPSNFFGCRLCATFLGQNLHR